MSYAQWMEQKDDLIFNNGSESVRLKIYGDQSTLFTEDGWISFPVKKIKVVHYTNPKEYCGKARAISERVWDFTEGNLLEAKRAFKTLSTKLIKEI